MTSRLQTPLLLALVLSACGEDPVEPARFCDDVLNDCGVAGFDLAIVSAEIDFDSDQPFRDEVDAHVVEPGDVVTARFRIVNRGTETSSAARVTITNDSDKGTASGAVPPLDAGEERIVEVEFETPIVDASTEMLKHVFATLTTDTTDWYDDADFDNNFSNGQHHLAWHPLVPILDVELRNVPDTILAAHPYILTATVTNRSPFVAADDVALGICLYPGNVECLDEPDGTPGSTGTLAAGDSKVVPIGLLAPHFWLDLNHPEIEVSLSVCIPAPAGWTAGIECVPRRLDAAVLPNLAEACPAPLLVAPATFHSRSEAAFCQVEPFTPGYFVHAFDADAGDQIRFTAQDGAENTLVDIYTVDAEWLDTEILEDAFVFTAPANGRFYVVTEAPFGTDGGEILMEEI